MSTMYPSEREEFGWALKDIREQHAALLRERDAQIASLTAQVEQQTQAFEDECGRHEQTLIGKRGFAVLVAQLGAELDAAQQERDSIATQLHAEIASERERRVAAQEAIALKYVPELEAARQQITTLTEALDVAAQDIRDWVKTARGLRDRVADPDHDPSTPHLRGIAESEQVLTRIYAALSSSTRPQEPQPAEPKSSETRKPVVNLMEALKKSLDSLNANRTSQEPGGHQP